MFSGKNKKHISICPLLKILPRGLSINAQADGMGLNCLYIIRSRFTCDSILAECDRKKVIFSSLQGLSVKSSSSC